MTNTFTKVNGINLTPQSVTPTGAVAGDVYYDLTTSTMYVHNGVSFQNVNIGTSSPPSPTGAVFDFVGTTAPTGYVLLDGKTIGSGASAATERANDDTVDLFTLIWNSMSNTVAPVSGGRGVSATADFLANKTITLPDARGRVIVGADNMGGSAASRMTTVGSGVDGVTLGASGGAQTHTLTTAQLASHTHIQNSHTHTVNDPGHVHSIPTVTTVVSGSSIAGDVGGSATSRNTNSAATGVSINAATAVNQTAGSDNAHNNTQPSLVLNKIIKL